MLDINLLITFVGLVLTIIFGVSAIKAHKEAISVMEEYRGFLYHYRDVIYEATKWIGKVKKGEYIKIMLDSTGFGDVTEKKAFFNYQNSLFKAANNGVDIELVYLQDNSLIEMLYKQQFPDKSNDYYEKLLNNAHIYANELTRRGVKIYRADSIPFLIFIFGGKVGMMSLQEFESGRVIPLAFVTKDKRSIDFLEGVFEKIKEQGSVPTTA